MKSGRNRKRRILALLMCLLMITTLVQGNGYSALAELVQGGDATSVEDTTAVPAEGDTLSETTSETTVEVAEGVIEEATSEVTEETTEVTEETTVAEQATSEADASEPAAASEDADDTETSETEVLENSGDISADKDANSDSLDDNFMHLVNEIEIKPEGNIGVTDKVEFTLKYALPDVIPNEDGGKTDPLDSLCVYKFNISDIIVTKDGSPISDFINAYTVSSKPITMGGNDVGVYSISEGGVVTLDFSDGLNALRNSATKRDGEFTFSCSLNDEALADSEATYKLTFATTPNPTEKEITVSAKEYANPDITINKESGEVKLSDDGDYYYVEYTITVENNGDEPQSNVVITDTIDGKLTFDIDSFSNTEGVEVDIDGRVANVKINELGVNGIKTIKYTCKLDDSVVYNANNSSGVTYIWNTGNKITATYGAKNQKIYLDDKNTKEQTVYPTVKKDVVSKIATSTETDETTGETKISWTVTINAGETPFNLKDTTITDVLGAEGNGQKVSDVSVSRSGSNDSNDSNIGGLKNYFEGLSSSDSQNSGYTFENDTTATYTITYTTTAAAATGQVQYSNKITATDGKNTDTATAKSDVVGGKLSSKEFDDNGYLNDDGTLTSAGKEALLITEETAEKDPSLESYIGDLRLPWKTKISVPSDATELVYKDYITEWDAHAYSFYPDQDQEGTFTLTYGDGNTVLTYGDDYTVSYSDSLNVTIKLTPGGLAKVKASAGGASNATLTISYKTLVEYSDVTAGQGWATTYSNSCSITVNNNYTETSRATVDIYKPADDETDDNAVTKTAVRYDAETQTMVWCIKVKASKNSPIESVTLTDTMKDMKYSGYCYNTDGTSLHAWKAGENKVVLAYDEDWHQYLIPIEEQTSDNSEDHPEYKYTINIKPTILNDSAQYGATYTDENITQTLAIYYTTKADGIYAKCNNENTYENNVDWTITTPTGTEESTKPATASQTVETTILDKTSGDVDGTSTIPYTLTVNPNAVRLTTNGEPYEIEDSLPETLIFQTEASKTKVVDTKTGKALDRVSSAADVKAGEYKYHVSYNNDTLVFTVPDEMALSITYQVSMLYDDTVTETKFTNSAKIGKPYVKNESESSETSSKKIAASSATINSSINLIVNKVDADDTRTLVEGAVIQATEYEYSPDNDGGKGEMNLTGHVFQATSSSNSYITDANFKCTDEGCDAEIQSDKIYVIEEIKAPSGYEKTKKTYTVIVISKDEKTGAPKIDKSLLPDGVTAIVAGTPLVFADLKTDTNKLTITKKYYDLDKTTEISASSAVDIEIYDTELTLEDCESGKYKAIATTSGDSNGFAYTKSKLGDVITLTEISEGTYTVYEKAAPAGFEKLERVYHFKVGADKTITWDSDEGGAKITGKELSEQIKNYKTIAVNFEIDKSYFDALGNELETPPSPAEFTYTQTQKFVTDESGKTSEEPVTSSAAVKFTASENGTKYTATGLTPGEYTINETENPVYQALKPYTLTVGTDGTVTVKDSEGKAVAVVNNNTIEVINTVNENELVVKKSFYLYDDNDPYETNLKKVDDVSTLEEDQKVKFTLYSYNGSIYEEVRDKNICANIDKAGTYGKGDFATFTYKNLIPGKYKLTESMANQASNFKYEQLYTVEFTVNSDYTITTQSSPSNTYEKTVNIENKKLGGDSARFYLQKYVADYQGNLTKVTEDGSGAKNKNNYEFRITNENDKSVDYLTYNVVTQRWETDGLGAGKYTIKEIHKTGDDTDDISYLKAAEDITIVVESGDPCKITSITYGNDDTNYINETTVVGSDLWTGTVSESGTDTLVVNLINRPKDNKITINKSYLLSGNSTVNYDFDASTGAKFELYKQDSSGGSKYTLYKTAETDDAETYTFKDLEPGTYQIRETAPAGFTGCNYITVVVGSDYKIKQITLKESDEGSIVELVNDSSNADSDSDYEKIIKVTNTISNEFKFIKNFTYLDGTAPTEDALTALRKETVFMCYNGDSSAHDSNTNSGNEVELGTDGVYKLSNLQDGTYYIHETKTPSGFKSAGDIKLDVKGAMITASYVPCPNDSNGKVSSSDFRGLNGNETTTVSATLYNRALENSLTVYKHYYNSEGKEILYSDLGGVVASFTLTNMKTNKTVTLSNDYSDVYKGIYVYKNLVDGTYTLSENTMTGFKKLEEKLTIRVKDGKITYGDLGKLDKSALPQWYVETTTFNGANSSGDVSSDVGKFNATVCIANQRYENEFNLKKVYKDGTGTEVEMTSGYAEFTLKNSSGAVIAELTHANSYTIKNLDPGTYTVTESYVPTGYKKPTGVITLTVAADRTIKASYDGAGNEYGSAYDRDSENRKLKVTFTNYESSNSITIQKAYQDANGNAIELSDLKQAEYASFKLLDENGRALTTTYNYVQTPEHGIYQFTNLPNGKYKIHEIAGQGYTPVDDIEITVSDDVITVDNGSLPNGVTVEKTEDKLNISLSVKNTRDKMQNSVTLYKEFYNLDSNQVTGDDASRLFEGTGFTLTMTGTNGKAVEVTFKKYVDGGNTYWKAENLEPGTYTINESEVADGYVVADDIILTVMRKDLSTTCTIGVTYKGTPADYESSSDNDGNYKITLRNHEKVTNLLVMNKQFMNANDEEITDTTAINNYMRDTEFTLTNANNEPVKPIDINGTTYRWKNLQNGDYTLTETSCNDKFLPATISLHVSENGEITLRDGEDYYGLQENADGDLDNQVTVNVKNYDKSTKVSISKTDITGTTELAGAKLRIYKADDKTKSDVVDPWTSEKSPHIIDKKLFEPGVQYVLEETTAPFGYEVAESIRFMLDDLGDIYLVDEDGNKKDAPTEEIIMKDDYKYLDVLKVNTGFKALAGATLQITDANSNVIDTWSSTTVAHNVQIGGNLVRGEYTLSEVSSPYGYKKAADIKFTFDDNCNILVYDSDSGKYVAYDSDTLAMVDMPQKIYFSKVDITNGNELPGATIIITDENGFEVVPSWVSADKPHELDVLSFEVDKEYYFTEITAPDGYDVAETIVFKIDSEGIIYIRDADGSFLPTDSDTIVMKDSPALVKTEDGNPPLETTVTTTESDSETTTTTTDVKTEEGAPPLETAVTTPESNSETAVTTPESSSETATNVKTGDSAPLKAVAALMLVSLVALMGTGICRKLKKEIDED